MKMIEFEAQGLYCKFMNTPEGPGCDNCPGDREWCADRLLSIADYLHKNGPEGEKSEEFVKQLKEHYAFNSYNILAIYKGELEFPN